MQGKDWNPFLQQQQRGPTMDDLNPTLCPQCQNSIFGRYFRLFKLKEEVADVPKKTYSTIAYVCANCAHVLDNEVKEELTSLTK